MAYSAEPVDWQSVLSSNGFKKVSTIIGSCSRKTFFIRADDAASAVVIEGDGCPPKVSHSDGTSYDRAELDLMKDLHYLVNPRITGLPESW